MEHMGCQKEAQPLGGTELIHTLGGTDQTQTLDGVVQNFVPNLKHTFSKSK